MLLVSLFLSSIGQAATYTVTSTNNSGNGTLRRAIEDANTSGGLDSIEFSIPGSGPHTILLTTKLDDITSPVVIDGTTEPDYVDQPVIYLDGSSAGASDGLHLGAGSGGSTIRGLAIGEFGATGIDIRSDGNAIEGNHIGSDVTGTLLRGNWEGLFVDGDDNVIGGSTPGAGNVIADNANEGIEIRGARTVVQGNSIGTDSGGSIDLGNEAYGILIWQSAADSTIGGTTSAARNKIAFSSWDGITLLSNVTGHSILGNAIYANGEEGIDLGDNGITANDAGDGDSGNNDRLNFPVITSAGEFGGTTSADFDLDVPAGEYRIEFFTNGSGTDPFNGEGETFGGAASITHTGSGVESFSTSFGGATGDMLTATTTEDLGAGDYGSTSEFGAVFEVVAGPPAYTISGTVFEDVNYGGGAGRDEATSSGAARSGVRVELYDASGNFADSMTTDGSGDYSFTGLAVATYTVRAVNGTVTSSRTGSDGSEVGVQTYRTDASSGSAVAVTNEVGGADPAKVDAGSNTTSATLASLSTATTEAESVTTAVVTAADIIDVDFGFNFDVIVNTNNDAQGSLRQFIANAQLLGGDGSLAQVGQTVGLETTIFMIPTSDPGYNGSGNGEFTIALDSFLPSVSTPMAIDGSTQTANIGNTNTAGPEIELDGSNAGMAVSGLFATTGSDGSTIRGLVINRFNGNALNIVTDDNTIAGNYLGTDVTGMLDRGNTWNGISLTNGASGNTIGGTNAEDQNIISGNSWDGVSISGAGTEDNLVVGNYIGTDVTGSGSIPNGFRGVVVFASASNNRIGGSSATEANLIAGNQVGVLVIGAGATGNAILGNSISNNSDLGIKLGLSAGPLANDSGDVDTGPNDLLNFPEITSAGESGGTVSVDFDLDVPAGDYRIEFFTNPSGADPSGNGEGEAFADALTITHTGSGVESFSHSFAGAVGDSLTSTATEESAGPAYGSTSEFSAATTVTTSLEIVKRAFWSDGTPIPTGASIPSGVAFKYLLYVNNSGAARLDVTVRDVLDPAFQYQTGTIQVDNSVDQCAASACTALEEQAIFAAADGATVLTDAPDVDVASYTGAGTSIDAGDGNVGNLQLDINGNAVWAILFSVKMP